MLSIGAMGKAGGGEAGQSAADYYLNLAREDYYTKGGEPPGQWQGQGAAALGLTGQVEREQFTRILAGYDPSSGEALVQHAGPDHRAGWDLTFSDPKSVSVLWSQADPATQRIIQAGRQAARSQVLAFMEENIAQTRRGQGGERSESVAGLIVAAFEHRCSREQDPQLHTHCLVANLAPRQDGTWGALESKPFYDWKMALGTLYRAELAQQLRERLPVDIERDR